VTPAAQLAGNFRLAARRWSCHISTMKRVLAGLALSVISHAAPTLAADAPGGYVIEQGHLDVTAPLDAEELQRFAQGIPPRVRYFPWISFDAWPGFFVFRCGECGGTYFHSSAAYLEFRFSQNLKFSVADLIVPGEAQGLRVVRGPDGAIQEAETMKNVYFIHQDKDVIVTERYMAFDCETSAEGRMKTLPGAVCRSRCEVRELAPDVAKGIRRFQTLVLGEQQGTLTMVDEFQETKGRVQLMCRNYKGDQVSPEHLTVQTSLQRVFWKDGPGYRQISKNEVRQADGSLQLTEHTITSWRVAKDGSRKLVDTQKLVEPPESDVAEPER